MKTSTKTKKTVETTPRRYPRIYYFWLRIRNDIAVTEKWDRQMLSEGIDKELARRRRVGVPWVEGATEESMAVDLMTTVVKLVKESIR